MWIPNKEYQNLLKTIPISCVDLIIINPGNEILMVKRVNNPAKNQWWFPGGRILHGETREEAVKRKLRDECGLSALKIHEIGTHDLLLNYTSDSGEIILSHGISTFYLISIAASESVVLDSQSSEFKWQVKSNWLNENIHPVIADILQKLSL